MKTVIEMAKEADLWMTSAERISAVERFAELARADERRAMMQLFTDPENQPTQHGTVTLKYMQREIAAEREAANNAYRERNQLVALLSTLFPSGKAKTAIEGWDEAWHGCVYIDFPWGQASWHYHTDDEWMFAHLPPYTKVWDGHTTEAKYAAIAAAIRARSKNEDRN